MGKIHEMNFPEIDKKNIKAGNFLIFIYNMRFDKVAYNMYVYS